VASRSPISSSWTGLGFVAFPMAVLFVFTLLPTVAGVVLSFFNWGGGVSAADFAGLEHYRRLATDDTFYAALGNTLAFVLLSVPVTVLAAFGLAVIVESPWFRGKALVRTMLFMPTIVSIAAVGFIWRWVLDDQGGLLNGLLGALGVADPPNWLNQGYWPMAWIIVIQVWRGVGFALVLYMSALSQIDRRLYEASALDGARRWDMVRHVTWPQVRPMTLFLMITGVIGALQVFDLVFVITGEQETRFTTVLNLYVYRQFSDYANLGYAATLGVVIFGITLVATALQLVPAWSSRGAGRSGRAARAAAATAPEAKP
jgi:ABC-type sugar transport system permease subunit